MSSPMIVVKQVARIDEHRRFSDCSYFRGQAGARRREVFQLLQ